MTVRVQLPSSLDSHSFEQVFDQLTTAAPGDPTVIDARACTFTTPFGLTTLLALAEARPAKPRLLVPVNAMSVAHWVRSGFFAYAQNLYTVEGTMPDRADVNPHPMLLEVSRVTAGPDRDSVIGRVGNRLAELFRNPMNLKTPVANDLMNAVSAWCAGTTQLSKGSVWVMAQVYRFENTGTRRYVMDLTICDSTLGLQNHPNPVGEFVALSHRMWTTDGTLKIRSGTARYCIAPPWDEEERPVLHDLSPFPGTQVQITMPDRVAA